VKHRNQNARYYGVVCKTYYEANEYDWYKASDASRSTPESANARPQSLFQARAKRTSRCRSHRKYFLEYGLVSCRNGAQHTRRQRARDWDQERSLRGLHTHGKVATHTLQEPRRARNDPQRKGRVTWCCKGSKLVRTNSDLGRKYLVRRLQSPTCGVQPTS
jgi:hypothetical protein